MYYQGWHTELAANFNKVMLRFVCPWVLTTHATPLKIFILYKKIQIIQNIKAKSNISQNIKAKSNISQNSSLSHNS